MGVITENRLLVFLRRLFRFERFEKRRRRRRRGQLRGGDYHRNNPKERKRKSLIRNRI